jgi:hypothetical protein
MIAAELLRSSRWLIVVMHRRSTGVARSRPWTLSRAEFFTAGV